MTDTKRVLTVSYGTFSCKLEGFDDPLGTMKAIAEYFRDLAAADRHFGAELPKLDAAMLAEIAERQEAQRVEAREHEGQIQLKALKAAAGRPPAQEAPSDAQDAAPEALSEATSEATSEALSEDWADPDPEPVGGEAEDSRAQPVGPAEETEPTRDLQDLIATPDEGAPQTAAPSGAAAFFANSPSLDQTEPEFDTGLEASAAFASFEPLTPAPGTEGAQNTPSESIAEKLQRIQSVVAQRDDETATAEEGPQETTAGMAEPDHANNADDVSVAHLAQEDDSPLSTETQAPTPAEDQFAGGDADAEQAPEAAEGGAGEAAARGAGADDASDGETAPPEEAKRQEDIATSDTEQPVDGDEPVSAEADTVPGAETEDGISAMLNRLDAVLSEQDNDLPQPADEGAEGAQADAFEENLFKEIISDTAPDAETAPAQGETTQSVDAPSQVKGRVLKVDRADLEAALDAGELDGTDTAEPATLPEPEAGDLRRASETAISDTPDETEMPPPDTSSKETTSAEDVSRLMAEADAQMDEPEGATRRSAFEHLRAAVAARFADKSMEKAAPEQETTQPYRKDLAQVIEPRRPAPAGTRTDRPSEPRPAPLRLGAEQRVDMVAPATDPITPRRVVASPEDDSAHEDDTGFPDFAAQMGARKLPDVIEAAAAYLSFVEQYQDFSRVQLMTRVRQADCGNFSREESLRIFGQLLRAGKIEKVQGGRFTSSGTIRFQPDGPVAG